MFTSNFKMNCLLAFNLDLIFSDGLGRVLNVFVRPQIDRQTDHPMNHPSTPLFKCLNVCNFGQVSLSYLQIWDPNKALYLWYSRWNTFPISDYDIYDNNPWQNWLFPIGCKLTFYSYYRIVLLVAELLFKVVFVTFVNLKT